MNTTGRIWLVAALFLAAAECAFGQATTLAVSPSAKTVAPAELFSVNVDIAAVTNLHAANVRIAYQNDIVQFDHVVLGPFLTGAFMPSPFLSAGPTHDTVTIDQAILGPGGRTGSGNLLTVFFLAMGGGTTAIDLTTADLRSTTNTQIPCVLTDGLATVDPSLPVTLAFFSVELTAEKQACLRWRTTSEVNNYGFVVQKRNDQEPKFVDLPGSLQPGHGTTTETHDYAYIDVTSSAGVWHYRLKQIDTHMGEHFSDAVTISTLTGIGEEVPPSTYGLQQNYPNPFNPSTTIGYVLPAAGLVRIMVFNALGEPVTELVNSVQAAGPHSVRWDGMTSQGMRAATGLYFCSMRAGDFTSVRKMLMVK